MQVALWFLSLFGISAAVALLLGSHQGSVTVFVSPYRVDLSINLVLLGLVLGFVVIYFAIQAIKGLFAMPARARLWRLEQKEKAAELALLDAIIQMLSGRFLRAIKSAQKVCDLAQEMATQKSQSTQEKLLHTQLEMLAQLIIAESAYALNDSQTQEESLNQLLDASRSKSSLLQDIEYAARLGAARWSLSRRKLIEATQWLDSLPMGVQRRTLALRLRLKIDRLSGHHLPALETTRLLAKHGAFVSSTAQSLSRSLAIMALDDCRDASQLLSTWKILENAEKEINDVVVHAASRLLQLEGDPKIAMSWVQSVFQSWILQPQSWSSIQVEKLVTTMEKAFVQMEPQVEWLHCVEKASLANPRNIELQYLSGLLCLKHGLWGKAQQLLELCVNHLPPFDFKRQAWIKLAQLAEQRDDTGQALILWRNAAIPMRQSKNNI
ncbi:MAG: heme biosynthesis protein HemY [Limnohabitans sp.]|nr:heme biosynthesis protein HemY [Limnohabitans sp.]